MGNFQSQSAYENLKKLYSLTTTQLDKLQSEIKRQNITNETLLNAIKSKQVTLQGRVPKANYNNVSRFLKGVTTTVSRPNTTAVSRPESFESQEDKFKRQFMEEQKEREATFYKQQKARRTQYETELNKFKMSANNAIRIFQLSEDFTMEQLKISYKKLALKFHPDRPKGNQQKFQVITKAYMSLLEDLKMRAPQQDFNDLKKSSQDFVENNRGATQRQPSDKFDPKLFNKIYEENRLHKADDDGYSNWINDNELEDKDIEKNEIFGDKFNVNVFNSTFKTSVKRDPNQIIKYTSPNAVNSFGNSIAELGVDKIDNFGGNGYSDYKEAHTQSRLVDEENIDTKKKFKSVEELKKHRENMVPLSLAELRELEADKKNDEMKETHRQTIVSKNDNKEFEIYDKMNQRLLQNDFFR